MQRAIEHFVCSKIVVFFSIYVFFFQCFTYRKNINFDFSFFVQKDFHLVMICSETLFQKLDHYIFDVNRQNTRSIRTKSSE